MANNKRVKLTADLFEVAKKYNCKIPNDTLIKIMNDNKTVLRFPNDYKAILPTIRAAKELIAKRIKTKKELY